jgi:hypothetical protein
MGYVGVVCSNLTFRRAVARTGDWEETYTAAVNSFEI